MGTESSSALIPDQRRDKLLRLLRQEGVMSIHQVTELLAVSHQTVRRDISELERRGLVYSVPGGVRLASRANAEPTRAAKSVLELPRKVAIARSAADRIVDGMTIYLDAGTTCQSVVPHLIGKKGITVVTNDFVIVQSMAAQIESESGMNVIHTGGRIDLSNLSSVGQLAAETLHNLHTDLAFISASAWSAAHGITTPAPDKVNVKRAAMASAAQSILLADSTKFGTYATFKVVALSQLDAVITDAELPDESAEGIRDTGVSLQLVPVTD